MVQTIKPRTNGKAQSAKSARAATASRKPMEGTANPLLALSQKSASPSMVLALARQLQSWSGSILGGMGTATDVALTLAQAQNLKPGPKAAVDKAAPPAGFRLPQRPRRSAFPRPDQFPPRKCLP